MKFILFFIVSASYSQEIARATISVGGTSRSSEGIYYVSQSIGQLSNIGFSDLFNTSIIQGFQQPSNFKISNTNNEIEAIKFYPVPTSDELNIVFSKSLEGICTIQLFDHLGRLVLIKDCLINDHKASISLNELATATYIVKILKNTSIFYETIIKN
jgi:hypothetical protein